MGSFSGTLTQHCCLKLNSAGGTRLQCWRTFCSFRARELKHVTVFLKAHDPITALTFSSSHTETLHVTPGSVCFEENSRKRHIWSIANGIWEVCTMLRDSTWKAGVTYIISVHCSSRGYINRGKLSITIFNLCFRKIYRKKSGSPWWFILCTHKYLPIITNALALPKLFKRQWSKSLQPVWKSRVLIGISDSCAALALKNASGKGKCWFRVHTTIRGPKT